MKDILRFILIMFLALFTSALTWFGLYSYGLSQSVSPYQTGLVASLSSQSSLIIEERIPYTKGQSLSPHTAIEIHYKNNDWVVNSLPKKIPLLNFLENSPSVIFFIKLRLNQSTNAAALKKIFNKNEHWKRIVLISDSDGTLKDLRELDPRWTFSTGDVFLTRFISLSSLGLQSLLKIPGDVFIINPKIFSSSKELIRLIKEVRRQNKLVLIGPVEKITHHINVHGWILVKD